MKERKEKRKGEEKIKGSKEWNDGREEGRKGRKIRKKKKKKGNIGENE